MKWLKAIVCLALLGGFVYGAKVFLKRDLPNPFVKPNPMATLTKGTEVPMLLLTSLDSGTAKVGSEIKLVVSEDVLSSDGRIALPQGSIATGEVVRSRGGTLGGAVVNQPARLEVVFKSVKAPDGTTVPLSTKDERETYEFTTANTSKKGSGNIVDAAADPEARDMVVNAAKKIVAGESGPTDEASEKKWKELADRYGLQETQKFFKGEAQGDRATDLGGALSAVQKGDLRGLTGTDVLLVAKAAGEIVDLGSGVDKSLRGVFKGSNIHAPVGTKVTGKIGKETKVRIKDPA
ncbi:MAG: hypothetical protein JSS66_01180 [Armatimonadetes bacterium]|nr:hypothetical protein [Armatimonadota bacterium]